MNIIEGKDFDSYWKSQTIIEEDPAAESIVKEIIASVRKKGDEAVREYAGKFDKSSPEKLEVPFEQAQKACEELRALDTELTEALELAAENLKTFSKAQRAQFNDFEAETQPGVVCGQRIIPVQKAAVYVPGGRFPLISSVIMTLIPAFTAGVEEVFFVSPPQEDGLPDKKILAAAAISYTAVYGKKDCGSDSGCKFRIFAIGGAQAIAAFAFGTESVPRADVIAGPGNKYVAAAKRQLYGQAGIDFIAGPSDVLIIRDQGSGGRDQGADLIAIDMLAQAEHDPDACARALVPSKEFADELLASIDEQFVLLPTIIKTAYPSLLNSGLIIIYDNKEEAIRIANKIAPEHLELHAEDAQWWIPKLKNYGSLFIGEEAAEVLGDYSAGVNHTLPTSGSARFTGGLSVRHFLKTVTTLRCKSGGEGGQANDGYEKVRKAAEIIARAEGLDGHALSAGSRQ